MIAVFWTLWQARRVPLGTGGKAVEQHTVSCPLSPWENARPGVKYMGDAACTRCHADIAETFGPDPMGRSLGPLDQPPAGR